MVKEMRMSSICFLLEIEFSFGTDELVATPSRWRTSFIIGSFLLNYSVCLGCFGGRNWIGNGIGFIALI